ncbi:unnamed protein product [Thelazia callipaeda]|uniref:C2H2-type domain-containing protein n=1 Tax=Thelazia callipaeda TaxID=103827 RepID=A0A0N5CLQ0_THECL|nr:unnamed protein product [Thelazia callipaeda]
MKKQITLQNQPSEATVPPPPVVICPTEVDNVNITLEKNQQCACKDCGKLFNSVWYLKQHAVKHSNDRPFRCKFCYKTYKFRSNLYQHKCPDRTKNGNMLSYRPFSKRLMCRITVNQSHLFDHRRSQIENRDFTLPTRSVEQCSEEIAVPVEPISPEVLTIKQQMELREITAPKIFLDQAAIDNYLEKYRNKLYQCRKCKLQFPSRGYLSRHTAHHNELEQLSVLCEMCPQRFQTDFELRKHSELHSKDSGIFCPNCNASFRSMLALRRHRNQCRECLSFISSFDHPASTDEFAYIDAVEANIDFGTSITNSSSVDEKPIISCDERVDCNSVRSNTDFYQHFAPDPTRSESINNDSDFLICENASNRTMRAVKFKLDSTPVVSVLNKNDDSNNDEQSSSENRLVYPEVNSLEVGNCSQTTLDYEQSGRLCHGNTFHTFANGHNIYGSCLSSDHIFSSHLSGMSGNSISGNSTSNNCTETSSTAGGGIAGSGELNFATLTFDSFALNSAGSVSYDSLVLEGSRPLIYHSRLHATKGAVTSQPAVDLISCTTLSIRNEISICEALYSLQTQFLRFSKEKICMISFALHIFVQHKMTSISFVIKTLTRNVRLLSVR